MGGGGEVWVRQLHKYVCVRTSGPLVVTDGILRTIIILFTIFCCINYGIIYCSSIDWCHYVMLPQFMFLAVCMIAP